jgi:hypothetical protein
MPLVIVVNDGEEACINVIHKVDTCPFQVGVELIFTGNLLKDPSGSVKTVNLFHHFTDLSVVQVAASNRWYSEFTDDSKDQFHTNLEWTRVYFVNNVDAGLFTIINDNHKRHGREEQGGPLLFMLLMQELFFTAQKTAKSLHTLMKQFRIDSVPRENIKSVSTTVMSISRRIWFSKKNTFPPEFLNTILKLFLDQFFRTAMLGDICE